MLLLLTLIYCGLVWLIFYKFKLLKFTKPRKVAVVVIGLVCLIYLLMALGRYMPSSASGSAFVQNPVVEVRTDVGGRVVEVWVTDARDVKEGEKLFQVQPDIYEYQLGQAEAALKQAEENVKALGATHDAAVADVSYMKAEQKVLEGSLAAAVANVATAKANVKAAQSSLAAAQADVEKSKVDVRIGEEQYARTQQLAAKGAATEADLDSDTRRIEGAKATLRKVEALEIKARDAVTASEAQLTSVQAAEAQTRSKEASLGAQLLKAEAAERQTRIQLEATVDGEHVTVRQAREAVSLAKWNLDHTITYAPADGYVVNPQLRVGTIVKALDKVMTFVCTDSQIVVASVLQYGADPIEEGDPVELTFKLYPGEIFEGEVERVAWATGESQPVLSGQIPRQDQLSPAKAFVVRIRVTGGPEDYPLRFGAAGTAAIYTEHASVFHIIRKVILRIESLLNYLNL